MPGDAVGYRDIRDLQRNSHGGCLMIIIIALFLHKITFVVDIGVTVHLVPHGILSPGSRYKIPVHQYSLESAQQRDSNEYSQHMFYGELKKIIFL